MGQPEQIIHYSRLTLPEGLNVVDEIEFMITWETDFSVSEGLANPNIRNEDLNRLLEKKIQSLLVEKSGSCAYIRHEKITHSINYAHGTHIITGNYQVVLYGEMR